MHIRTLSATLVLVAMAAAACDDNKESQSPGDVLARDSALATDLRQIDTSSFAEAADVAMAFNPDSALPTAAPASARSTSPSVTPAPAPAAPAPAVPMRVDRSATPSASPATRPPLRPKPATIHPDPLPGPGLPATGTHRSESASNGSVASAAAILERVPGASLPQPAASDPCASPAAPDQRRCLMTHLARSDAGLDRTYQALITDLKRQAGTSAGAPEPQSVKELREAQRAWLVYRDTECRRRNRGKEGALWAPIRAQCLGEFSGVREAELARARRH